MEKLISNRGWSICYSQEDIFRKYYKYANFQQARREGFYAKLCFENNICTPPYIQTLFSKEKEMFYSDYQYYELKEIEEKELFQGNAYEQILTTIMQMQAITFHVSMDDGYWDTVYLPEIRRTFDLVKDQYRYQLNSEWEYLINCKKDTFIHGDYSLVNLFMSTERNRVCVVDFQSACIGIKDWDLCYFIASTDPQVIPLEIIKGITKFQHRLIKIICLLKLGRGLRKGFDVKERLERLKYWEESEL